MMTKLEKAEKVVEFAKENGFPNASVFLWCEERETSYGEPRLAMDDIDDGQNAEFQVSIHLADVTLQQKARRDQDGEYYSDPVELSP